MIYDIFSRKRLDPTVISASFVRLNLPEQLLTSGSLGWESITCCGRWLGEQKLIKQDCFVVFYAQLVRALG
ncbi:unnamed protein product [Ilex paraguariensis]|uniref:Uncharacterized protein n=1 Tax=Ilex paraguariensis TaxID=185542 RepID=A0ABC8THN5_9AQUA